LECLSKCLTLGIPKVPTGASMMKKTKIRWFDKPQKHDYPAAESYLSLILRPREVRDLIAKLRRASVREFAAKDIFRASGLPMLRSTDSHVERYRALIILKEQLSPVLLFRDSTHGRVVIADGYHRLCAVYSFDEDAMIPCQIV
jgi:hypothetical protein